MTTTPHTVYRADDAARHPDAISFLQRAIAARDGLDSVATWQPINTLTRAALAEGANVIEGAMSQRAELLAACESALAWFGNNEEGPVPDKLRAAIAKARGE